MGVTATSKTARLLVVDDEQFVRDLLSDFFANMDFAVVTAADGNHALAACRSGRFEAALVDLKMPGMGGIQVLEELHHLDPSLPVIVMTGYPTIDSSIEAIRRGAYDYIIKPFKLKELKERVDRAVREMSLAREIEQLRDRLGTVEDELRRYRARGESFATAETAGSSKSSRRDG